MPASRKRPARKKPANIDAIIDSIEAPEGSVTLCLKASLVAEYEELADQLEQLTANPVNLAGDSPGKAIAEQMEQLRADMAAHDQVFRFRAVTPRGEWRRLLGKRPVKTDDLDDDAWAELYHAWVCGVVATSSLDPVMTQEQVLRLADKLSDGQWSKLASKAWSVNDEVAGIPFNVAASVLTRSSGEKSQQPEPPANPAHGSLAGSPG